MFTGIVETTAEILNKTDKGLTVSRPAAFDDVTVGSSVNVNGACLTVIAFDDTAMTFDVIPETWARTNLGDHQPGDKVNLERALAANGRFEGHIVQGHVEGTATIANITEDGEYVVFTLELPEELMPFVVPKGGIAIDGISLTVVDVKGSSFSVALIPHTLAITNLGTRHAGDTVNIETDVLGRYLLNFMTKRA